MGKQIASPQIRGLIPLLHICNFRCASPQIANPQIFKINPQTANLQISAKILQKLSITVFTECYICKEKKYVFADFRTFSVRKSQKRLCPQTAIPQSAKFAKGPQI
jgi:hypothetical protein